MNPSEFPTPWQRKTIWSAVTALAMVAIGGISVGTVWLTVKVVSFLQPILVPFAVAMVLAYLLEPVVSKLADWHIPRRASVLSVFAVVFTLLLWGALWLIPVISHQTVNLYNKADQYTKTARSYVIDFAKGVRQKYGVDVLPSLSEPQEEESHAQEGNKALPESAKGTASEPPRSAQAKSISSWDELLDVQQILKGDWLKNALITVGNNSLLMVRSSVGGFLSVFGFLVSLIIIPVYLFYFLIDAKHISESWQDYLPLKNSRFKTEVVSTLTEINGYVIAFFRGQLLVSFINGISTAIGLMIVGLDFGLLIGLTLCLLGLIPYMGILICWIPAVIIASVQRGAGSFVPAEPVWLFPAVVTGIFLLVQKIDSFYITPKVVEKRVGLHSLTVIVSLFVWSLLLGGLLGAIIAVPLTATIKVLLRRYVWERRILRAND
ncbi:MAG: AI-2E family transporter, partial [Verrucomicrobia bacterium]|nr:AI-2E family transporter [Verrucomicrobiota bacterium]